MVPSYQQARDRQAAGGRPTTGDLGEQWWSFQQSVCAESITISRLEHLNASKPISNTHFIFVHHKAHCSKPKAHTIDHLERLIAKMDTQQAEFLGNGAFFNILGDLMILKTFVEPDFNQNYPWRLVAGVTAALARDFIISSWPENVLSANVVPLPNDHDEVKRLLSGLKTGAHEFSHMVSTLKKSFAPCPPLLQTPSGHPDGVQIPRHHRDREVKPRARRTLFLEKITVHKGLKVIANGEIPSMPSPNQHVKWWLEEKLG